MTLESTTKPSFHNFTSTESELGFSGTGWILGMVAILTDGDTAVYVLWKRVVCSALRSSRSLHVRYKLVDNNTVGTVFKFWNILKMCTHILSSHASSHAYFHNILVAQQTYSSFFCYSLNKFLLPFCYHKHSHLLMFFRCVKLCHFQNQVPYSGSVIEIYLWLQFFFHLGPNLMEPSTLAIEHPVRLGPKLNFVGKKFRWNKKETTTRSVEYFEAS